MNKNPIYATLLSPLVEGLLVDLMQDPTVVFDATPGSVDDVGYGYENIRDEDPSTRFSTRNSRTNDPVQGDWFSVTFAEAKEISSIYLLPFSHFNPYNNNDECS